MRVRVLLIEIEKSVCVRPRFNLCRRLRRSSAIPFLHTPQSVLEKHGERERQSEARKRWKDFMPPPRLRSSAVCFVWLGGKVVRRANELPTHKYTAAGDAGAIYHDWKPLLCPPLLARHLWHPQCRGEITQLEQHQIGLFQMGRVHGGCFHLDCGSPGVCELVVDKHGSLLCLTCDPSIWPSAICYS